MLVGRDTRGSGPELEQAVARGISAAGGTAVLGGVLPTPAVAFLADDLGIVVSASHNPPEYNGVKVFRGGGKLVDEQEEEIESLLDAPAPGRGAIEEVADSPTPMSAMSSRRAARTCRGSGSVSTARTARSRRSRPALSSNWAPRCA